MKKSSREKLKAEKAARRIRGFDITNVPEVNNFKTAGKTVSSNGTAQSVTAGQQKAIKSPVPASVNNFEACVPTMAKSLNTYPAETKTKQIVELVPAVNGVAAPENVHPTPKLSTTDTFVPVITAPAKKKAPKS